MNNKDSNNPLIYKFELRKKTISKLRLLIISAAIFVILASSSIFINEFGIAFFIILILSFVLVLVFLFLTYKCDKKVSNYMLPPIDNKKTLDNYLKFFLNTEISNFDYALTLSWISELIVEAKNNLNNEQDNDHNNEQKNELREYIYKLYEITKPYGSSNGYCLASYRRKAFQDLINKIINKEDTPLDFENFQNDDSIIDLSDKAFIFYNLSVIVFITIM